MARMSDDEINDAVSIMKRRVLNVGAIEMDAERHVALIQLIIDSEAVLHGFPVDRSRSEIEAAITEEMSIR
jgi:hypothetical protein